MVLDTQSTSAQFEPDTPPSSTPDPYSFPPSAIDFSQLPTGFYLPLPLFKKDRWNNEILKTVQAHAASVHRPLTPDETKALAYHTAKSYAICSWDRPIGCLIGAYRTYATREKYGFPFFGALKREGGLFDGERIEIMGRVLLRGENARFIINTIRYPSHAFVAGFFTMVASTIYAAFVTAAHMTRDPRLKEYKADLKASTLRDREELKQRIRQGRATTITEDGTRQRKKSLGELWKEHKDATEGGKARRHEESPLAGGDGMEYAGDEGMLGASDVGEAKSGDQIMLQETRQQSVPRDSPRPHRTAEERQPMNFTDHDPDPSPPAESDWSQETSDSGSAWERLRRGAKPPAATGSGKKERGGTTGGRSGSRGWQQRREQREGSGSMGDDFTFSSSEQERSYAREEAQRDFDARVEKERRGGDFSDGNGGRRWG